MKKLQIVFATVLAISMLGAGYAISLVTQTIQGRVNVVVRYGQGPIRAYWEVDKTNLVVTVDFGNVLQGDTAVRDFFIFNEDATYHAIVDWSSDIGTVTSGKITDSFGPDIHSYDLGPGQYVWVDYIISVASDCPILEYTWTLSLGVA